MIVPGEGSGLCDSWCTRHNFGSIQPAPVLPPGYPIMALVPLRVVLDHAAENDYGVAAFNVNNMEQIQAIMEAAEETDSPVIIQASRGRPSLYSQDAYLRHLMLAATELYPHIPIVMHQDHGNSPDTCQSPRSTTDSPA